MLIMVFIVILVCENQQKFTTVFQSIAAEATDNFQDKIFGLEVMSASISTG